MPRTRKRTQRAGKSTAASLILGALVFLGIAASGLLVFSTNITQLRLGLVAALWAAIISAIGMAKFRRQSVADEAAARDQQTVYELQLEREISARREFEMHIEARVRREVRADANEIAELRAELAALRRNLERLFEGPLPFERPTIDNQAKVAQQISAPAAPELAAPEPAPVEVESVELGPPSGPARPAPRTTRYAEPGASQFSRPNPERPQAATPEPAPRWDTGFSTSPPLIPTGSHSKVSPAFEPPQPAAFSQPAPAAPYSSHAPGNQAAADSGLPNAPMSFPQMPTPADDEPEPAGSHSQGNSVAEILARLQGSDPDGAPRRRRHRL